MTTTEEFLNYLQAEKRYSPLTVKAYKTDLYQFHAFCRESGHEGMDLHFKTIRSWVVHMMDRGITPRTIHKKLTGLSTFCKFLVRQGELEANPVERVLKPRMKKRNPVFVEDVVRNVAARLQADDRVALQHAHDHDEEQRGEGRNQQRR